MTILKMISTGHVFAGAPCRRPQDVADGCREQGVRVRVAGKQVWSVGRVASWDGYCLPCGREDRPLVLTRSGATGLRAWVAGIGDDDRTLLLTCRVCGEWQIVPLREEDDPETAVEEVLAAPVAPVVAVVRPAAAPVSAAVRLPSPRTAPAAVVIPALELVLLPLRSAPTQPAVPSSDAVAAARSVLSAARAGQQRSATPRPARPASRRGHRRGPTPRRPDHAGARKPRPSVVPVAEATSIVLPLDLLTSGHSVLLAAG